MYRTRAVTQGRLAEIFGEAAIPIDKFTRTIGFNRLAKETYKTFNQDQIRQISAFVDGINDFVKNVKFMGEGSANLLPPEFYVFGMADNLEEWTIDDTLANIVLINFSLTWDWGQDYVREILKLQGQELDELTDQLIPYTMNYLDDLTTVLDDSDLKRMGKWDEKTLSQKYKENYEHLKSAEPKRDYQKKETLK